MARPLSSRADSARDATLRIWEQDGWACFGVKAQPGAKRERVLGLWNGLLRVAVQAPPDAGRANEAILSFLAATTRLPRSQFALASGAKSREKGIAVRGVSADSLRRILEGAMR